MGHQYLYSSGFFQRPSVEIAPELLGAKLCCRSRDGRISKFTICETEAYHGVEDLASHACRGKNSNNQIMFGPPNFWYLYLCYGVHWMLNIITANEGQPSAVFFRATLEVQGPGRLTQKLGLNKSFNGLANHPSSELWLERSTSHGFEIFSGPRIGISRAGPIWSEVPYRFWFSKTTQVG